MAGAQHAAQSYCWVAQGPLLIQIAVHLPCNSDSAFVTPWITNPNFFRFPPWLETPSAIEASGVSRRLKPPSLLLINVATETACNRL